MGARGGELIATNEPAVVPKPFLDAIVVENGQGDGRFPDPPCANESDRSEVFGEINNILDQVITSETGPRWRRRELSRRDGIRK